MTPTSRRIKMSIIAIRFLPAVLLAACLAGCGNDETEPEETHTPASAAVFVGGVDVTSNLILPAGETVRVEVRFYNDEEEEITGIDDDHFTALTFTPAGLATTADVVGENFQEDVTAQATLGTGTYTVGYGHDQEADELTFGPFDVSVVLTGVGAR
jgi:hypothetical protein